MEKVWSDQKTPPLVTFHPKLPVRLNLPRLCEIGRLTAAQRVLGSPALRYVVVGLQGTNRLAAIVTLHSTIGLRR